MTAVIFNDQNVRHQDSVGTFMTQTFVTVLENCSVEEAIHLLRHKNAGSQGKYYIYAIDNQSTLKGVIPLRSLIRAQEFQSISQIMFPNVISVKPDTDQEEVAKIMIEHGFVSIPVINESGALIGIVNADDVLDIMEEEATEDFQKLGSVGSFDTSLKEASVGLLFKKRIGWLLALIFVNVFSGAGMSYFKHTIEAMVSLIFFLPLLIGSGGNAGGQASTLMVRSMATGEIKLTDWAKLLGKEFSVAGLMGISMGIAASALGFFRSGQEVAVVVAISMVIIVLAGSLIGMSLPFALRTLQVDPATASAPLVTSIADVSGVLIYFSIATWYLGLGVG